MQSSLTPLALALALGAAFSVSAQDQTGSLFSPYLEWKLDHANHSGNPFEVEGKAVFTHAVSGETRTTGMFYNGGNTWRFRFTATRTGKWTFQTRNSAAALNGKTGSIVIDSPVRGKAARGFVTSADGNRCPAGR